eukprot:m.1381390 g.1381390  ORF g.1381390 m.1381390 type:complete len:67 (+) comp24970_c0_seq26:223-423(+)
MQLPSNSRQEHQVRSPCTNIHHSKKSKWLCAQVLSMNALVTESSSTYRKQFVGELEDHMEEAPKLI